MPKRKRFPWIIFLGFSGIVIFLFRTELLNSFQRQILNSIREKAFVSNHFFIQGNGSPNHLIYSLRGLDRIWPHRVNSLRRLKYLYNNFAGFECDVRFDAISSHLFVAHDPEDLSSLVFSDFLLQEGKAHKLFWLDLKNLEAVNTEAFCGLLERLDKKFLIKNRIIIESSNFEALEQVRQQGWLTSYYMPAENVAVDYHLPSILKDQPGLISQDISMHDFMTKNFPGKKQLIWDLRFWDCMSRKTLLKNANDTTVLVCLINVKSPGYR
jgi:hypothetical protein